MLSKTLFPIAVSILSSHQSLLQTPDLAEKIKSIGNISAPALDQITKIQTLGPQHLDLLSGYATATNRSKVATASEMIETAIAVV